MCSTTRGPAIWPSLVTWPTRITAAPVRLAKRMSSPAEPRTWVTVPGAASTGLRPHGLDRIDDQKPGRSALRQRRHDVLDRGFGGDFDQRRRRAQAVRRAAAPAPPLLRRKYRRRGDGRARRLPPTSSSSVDLPMPGSPPSSSTEPRTRPPPVTRSNSAMPEASRGASCDSPLSGSTANNRPLREVRRGPSAPSSTSVFHSPQASHLPAQRA